MRIVCDTNVLVRAGARPNGVARALLTVMQDQGHVLIVSPLLLIELRRVLDYPHVRSGLQLTDEIVEEFLAGLEEASSLVHPPMQDLVSVVIRDPDDDPILQTAVAGKADVLCTLDRHFYTPEVLAYCASHSIRILTDVELLRELRAASRETPAP